MTASVRVLLGWLLLVFAIGTSHAQVTNGVVGWWKFDEGSGTNVNDSSGNGRSGIVYNGTWTTNRLGQPNMALQFNGNSSRIDIPGTESLNLLGGPLTLSAWVLLTGNNPEGFIVAKHTRESANEYMLVVKTTNSHFGLMDLRISVRALNPMRTDSGTMWQRSSTEVRFRFASMVCSSPICSVNTPRPTTLSYKSERRLPVVGHLISLMGTLLTYAFTIVLLRLRKFVYRHPFRHGYV